MQNIEQAKGQFGDAPAKIYRTDLPLAEVGNRVDVDHYVTGDEDGVFVRLPLPLADGRVGILTPDDFELMWEITND